ncbi:Zinc finger protein ZAT1 [Senna tora]|uniref:Zinc finger protein ZAT1 n=1 Tax=Senna tora TaxID=362788 RepID=A0A834SUN8_9FABA|nr:Zinc finger protein ZAT1 [Senna tora]
MFKKQEASSSLGFSVSQLDLQFLVIIHNGTYCESLQIRSFQLDSSMEEERKFVCKYCNKKFPCGKSLGGHIRTHMTTSSHSPSPQVKIRRTNYNNDDDDDGNGIVNGGRKRKRDLVSEEDSGNPIYGLRENPKKTTRFVHSNNNNNNNNSSSQQERICKECGKSFSSLKALCGHMACHSEKDKPQKLLVMDDSEESDTETYYSGQNHHNHRRSKRMRFKASLDSNSSNTNTNNNSSVSEVEQEQEELARCLMLLSKDTNYKGPNFVFPTESSDNNSVVLEAKSPSVSTRIVEEDKNKKNKSKDVCSENSGSGYLKKLDSAGLQEFKTPKVEQVRSCDPYDAESRKKKKMTVMLKNNRGKTRGSTEPRRLFLDDSRKREENYDSLSQNNIPTGGVSWKNKNKNKKKTPNANDSSAYESDDDDDDDDESSTDTDSYPASPPKPHSSSSSKSKKKLKSKKSKEHECPICYKTFSSGQALGGHKRSHFVGGSEENNTVIIKQDSPPPPPPPPVVQCLIDLNLPAPQDD